MLCQFKLEQGQYAFWFGFSRGEAPIRFAEVRRMFPDEELFTYYADRNRHIYKRQSAFPSTNGCNELLCLRNRPYPPEDETAQRQRRLCLMLNAFEVQKRRAKYEADLVASWATMCDLK